MPLLDHFHPPLSRTHPWRGFHGAWASAIARLLNANVLPPGYYAVPFLDRDGPVEIDVATLQNNAPTTPSNGTAASPQWTPTEPGLTVAVEWPTSEDVGVEIFSDEGDPQLAATVELVSPRNKDRPAAREAFVAKCAGYLRQGCGVVVVDVVTTRRTDLHAELLTALGVELTGTTLAGLSAISYRSVGREEKGRLLAWPESLAVDQLLPTVPLWLAGEIPVPLDLEAGYTTACVDLRIRHAS